MDLENGTCIFANRRASEHFGVPMDEVEGLVTKPFYPGDAVRKDISDRILSEGRVITSYSIHYTKLYESRKRRR